MQKTNQRALHFFQVNSIILIIIFFIFFVFISGCQKNAQQPISQEKPSQEIVLVTNDEDIKENENVIVDTTKNKTKQTDNTPIKNQSKALLRLIELAEKAESYQYVFNAPPEKQSQDQVYIRGAKMRIDLQQSDVTLRLPYTKVYINHDTKTAHGTCYEQKPRCKEKTVVEIPYDAYLHPTPMDWLDLVKEHATDVPRSETHDEKKTRGAVFMIDGNTYTVFMDITFGLPVRVEIEGPREHTYNYRNLVINSASKSMVELPK